MLFGPDKYSDTSLNRPHTLCSSNHIRLFSVYEYYSQPCFLSLYAKQEEEGVVFSEEDKNGTIIQDVKEDGAATKVQASLGLFK